jgi:hypothetical protein
MWQIVVVVRNCKGNAIKEKNGREDEQTVKKRHQENNTSNLKKKIKIRQYALHSPSIFVCK